MHIPEAHSRLPAEPRRASQSLSRPDDIVFGEEWQAGGPEARGKVAGAKGHAAEAALGGSGPAPGDQATEHRLVLDAPKNLWVKGQDLNVEVGLSPDFRVEVGEETASSARCGSSAGG